MQHYELILMVQMSHMNQIEAILERYKNMITEDGGSIDRQEDWGRRDLAYTIQRHKKAHYLLLNFQTSTKVIQELQRLIRYNDSILRSLLTKTDEAPQGDSIFLENLRKEQANQEKRRLRTQDAPTASSDSAAKEGEPQTGEASEAPKAAEAAGDTPAQTQSASIEESASQEPEQTTETETETEAKAEIPTPSA